MERLLAILATPTRQARFRNNIEAGTADECWPWKRAINTSGYGVLRVGEAGERFTVMAHRAAWMLANESGIPDAMQIDHICGTRSCCNPRHLRLVTRSENVRSSSKHKAGNAAVVRVGPVTVRRRRGRFMATRREYLVDGSVRQAGRTFDTMADARGWR